MPNAIHSIDPPVNEPVFEYRPGSDEREQIKDELQRLRNTKLEIPLIIGGRVVKTGNLGRCIIPHDHGHQLAVFHQAGEKSRRNERPPPPRPTKKLRDFHRCFHVQWPRLRTALAIGALVA